MVVFNKTLKKVISLFTDYSTTVDEHENYDVENDDDDDDVVVEEEDENDDDKEKYTQHTYHTH